MPYDPWLDRLVLIEQLRVGALHLAEGPWLLEFVAGMIEPGESGDAVVLREAREEAGCEIGRFEHVCDYLVSPGGTSEMISLYCGCTHSEGVQGIHGLAEEHEDIRVTTVSVEEAFEMLDAGRFISATPIIALQWLRRHHNRLRAAWT